MSFNFEEICPLECSIDGTKLKFATLQDIMFNSPTIINLGSLLSNSPAIIYLDYVSVGCACNSED